MIDQDIDRHSSVRSVTSAHSFSQSVTQVPVYQFDSFPPWNDSVSYTHLRAPRDLSTSRMPSSA